MVCLSIAKNYLLRSCDDKNLFLSKRITGCAIREKSVLVTLKVYRPSMVKEKVLFFMLHFFPSCILTLGSPKWIKKEIMTPNDTQEVSLRHHHFKGHNMQYGEPNSGPPQPGQRVTDGRT